MLFGVGLLADGGGGGVIVLFTGELVFELLKGGVLDCEFEGVFGFDVVLFPVGPLLVMLFGVVLLADGGGGGVIVLFTGELVFELLKGGVLDRRSDCCICR